MAKRIIAWILLALFVLLLLNVMFFKFYWQISLAVYIIIMFGFVLYSSRAKRMEELEKFMDMDKDKDKDKEKEKDTEKEKEKEKENENGGGANSGGTDSSDTNSSQ